MLDLKDLQCLSALARHKHFARAAADCAISQPAFSTRIRKIEERLQTSIVKRGNRYLGLTEDGMMIVRHARTIMDEIAVFEQEFRCHKGMVSGHLRLGVIPTVVGYVSLLTIDMHREYPNIVMRIETASSLAIQQGLEDGVYDAGITYTHGAPADLLRVEPLFDERYVLLVPRRLAPRESGEITWREAAELPLTLLEPGMQNRRIVDAVFAELEVVPNVVAEMSGFTSAMVMAAQGLAATVLPAGLAESLGGVADSVILPLTAPVQEKSVCLISARRDISLPTLEALRRVAQGPR